MSSDPASRLVLISTDCHAGGNHEMYRSYLAVEHLDEFDRWRGQHANLFKDLQGGTKNRNWDDERRVRELPRSGW